jgi:hypothetical protein
VSSSWPMLASRHSCDQTCHCRQWWRDAEYWCAVSTSTGSSIGMAV